MVKLWGGVFCILFKGGRSAFIHLLIFNWFYWFYRFYWFFIDFIDFLSIFIDFIDFSPVLLIFHRFHLFLLVFNWFCLFSKISQQFFTELWIFNHFYRCYCAIMTRKCAHEWSAAWCTILTKSYGGSYDICIPPRGCLYSRNTENF